MSDLQKELKEKVLTPEQEINNAVNYKVTKGPGGPPEWVKRGKLTNYKRLVEQGYSAHVAAEKSNVSTHSILRWGRALKIEMPIFKRGGRRPKGSKVGPPEAAPRSGRGKMHTYEPSFRKAMAERAMAMLRAGEIVNISEAAPKLGVHGTTLNSWCRQYGLIESRRSRKRGVSHQEANGRISIDTAVAVFAKIFPDKPQSQLKFENALLRAALESKS